MKLAPWVIEKLSSLALIIGFFAIWEICCLAFHVSSVVLPRPSQILTVLVIKFAGLWPNILQTLFTTIVGFVLGTIVAVVLGVCVGVSRLLYNAAYPLLVGFSSIPKVAVVPIFVLWFGSGTTPAILTAMTTCVFPIVVNIAMGLATTEPEMEDVLKALGASQIQVLWNVGLPRSLPYFFASLKIAVTLAFVGTVLSETVAANRGIGTVIVAATANFDMPLAFAALFALALMGILLYVIFALIEQRVCGWATRKSDLSLG